MTTHRNDAFMDGLFRRALVPPGFRPRTDEELEQALDALSSIEVSQDKVRRILKKISGECSFDSELYVTDCTSEVKSFAEPQELVEMFRAEGEEIPPEIAERLDELEREAAREAEDEDDDSNESAE